MPLEPQELGLSNDRQRDDLSNEDDYDPNRHVTSATQSRRNRHKQRLSSILLS